MTGVVLHLAELNAVLNVGSLSASTDTARVAGVMAALDRLDHLRAPGDSDHAFGWKSHTSAQAWHTHGCAKMTAE